jgi:hypothetical protein
MPPARHVSVSRTDTMRDGRDLSGTGGALILDAGSVRPPGGLLIPDANKLRPPGGALILDAKKLRPPGGSVFPDAEKLRPPGGALIPDASGSGPPGGAIILDAGKLRPPGAGGRSLVAYTLGAAKERGWERRHPAGRTRQRPEIARDVPRIRGLTPAGRQDAGAPSEIAASPSAIMAGEIPVIHSGPEVLSGVAVFIGTRVPGRANGMVD